MVDAVAVYSQNRRNRFRIGAIWNNVGEFVTQCNRKDGFKLKKGEIPFFKKGVFKESVRRFLKKGKTSATTMLLLLF